MTNGFVAGIAHLRGYDLADCYAYSDSITDLPMLEAVGHRYLPTYFATVARALRPGP